MSVPKQNTILGVVCIIGLFSGCGNPKESKETTDLPADTAATTAVQQVCYRQVMGSDTTKVNLFVNGAVVMGELAVLPAEKDRATGKFSGTMAGNQVVADWERSGEGVTQTHEVNFTMKGDSLLWREGERVEKQGKWVLADPDKGYQYVLTKVDCN